jgi:H+-transporting ATPase
VVRHWLDFFIILPLLASNAVVGFWEEHQAGNAIAALKAKLAIKARVKRDGKWATPAAREVVPGDVIRVRLGDIVPADARLSEGDSVEVDQSALTCSTGWCFWSAQRTARTAPCPSTMSYSTCSRNRRESESRA